MDHVLKNHLLPTYKVTISWVALWAGPSQTSSPSICLISTKFSAQKLRSQKCYYSQKNHFNYHYNDFSDYNGFSWRKAKKAPPNFHQKSLTPPGTPLWAGSLGRTTSSHTGNFKNKNLQNIFTKKVQKYTVKDLRGKNVVFLCAAPNWIYYHPGSRMI